MKLKHLLISVSLYSTSSCLNGTTLLFPVIEAALMFEESLHIFQLNCLVYIYVALRDINDDDKNLNLNVD